MDDGTIGDAGVSPFAAGQPRPSLTRRYTGQALARRRAWGRQWAQIMQTIARQQQGRKRQ